MSGGTLSKKDESYEIVKNCKDLEEFGNEIQEGLQERMMRHHNEGNDELGKWYWEKAWGSFYRRVSFERDRIAAWYELNKFIRGVGNLRNLRFLVPSDLSFSGWVYIPWRGRDCDPFLEVLLELLLEPICHWNPFLIGTLCLDGKSRGRSTSSLVVVWIEQIFL